jgi:thiosulfate dehydrogenase
LKRLLLAALLAAGCTETAKDYGKSLFSQASVSPAKSNVFSCSTCHDVTATPTKVRNGYTMFDVVNRPNWWGGFETTLIDAINVCVTNFMEEGGKPLDATSDEARGIFAYLQSLSPDATSPALALTVTKNIVDIPSGDPMMGEQVWKSACAGCHGDPHTGNGRLGSNVSLVPDDSIQAHGTDPKTGARPVVIEKVRHGKFYNVGGVMALFSLEALSDAQLGQILGYLEQFGLPKSVPTM